MKNHDVVLDQQLLLARNVDVEVRIVLVEIVERHAGGLRAPRNQAPVDARLFERGVSETEPESRRIRELGSRAFGCSDPAPRRRSKNPSTATNNAEPAIDQTIGNGTCTDGDRDQLRQLQPARDRDAEQRADEPDGDRADAAALRVAGNRLPDSSTNAGDDEQKDELDQGQAHGPRAMQPRTARLTPSAAIDALRCLRVRNARLTRVDSSRRI